MALIQSAQLFPQEATFLYLPRLCSQLCCLNPQKAHPKLNCAITVRYVLVSKRMQTNMFVLLIDSILV